MLNSIPQTATVKVNLDLIDFNTVPHVWLRIYPLAKQSRESFYSLIFRCVFCILGLYTLLIIWTVIWVFIIHSFEGPYEAQTSIDFEENQNQLVIDLATELRLITPLSPKWKDAITKRIEDERQLTIVAVAKGAKLHPGEFWDLSGTFLFTIYVMTALGFGAPVPHTLWGRTSALLYALLAVPIHLYLMLNISTCVIAHVDACTNNLRNKLSERKPFAGRKSTLEMISQNPNYSRDSEILHAKYNSCFRKMIMVQIHIFKVGGS
ncbi:hypothetical protein K1T71_011837 [Dendrolimus kikuchii]|uniref:Uncharacterized protein n=1 Tax=Dendrolimus kikuchii TaxID=765133 RepID=A0ACC1CM77_9NEOP|nr:hypothetical protein K1T71_011837 [Dendrolimus kikuchii]